jgi:uridine kinase
MRPLLDAASALDRIVAALAGDSAAAPDRAPIVLLDGRSGSGKSTIATLAAERMPDATLLRLDDVYPGWDGLLAASEQLVTGVLGPHSRQEPGHWRRWDWTAGLPGPEETVDPSRPLLVEGVGALPSAARPLAALTVWVELDDATRRERALDRDGDAYAPHWTRWAAQEEEYLAREHPAAAADLVIDGRSILG